MKNPNPPPYPDEIRCRQPEWRSGEPCNGRAFLTENAQASPRFRWFYVCVNCRIAHRPHQTPASDLYGDPR